MQIRRTVIATTAVIALALAPALTACGGGAAESIAENAAENAMGGGDVEINDEGVTVTDPSGNAMAAGENVALPDNWPTEVPVPDGGTLTFVTVTADGSASAIWTVDGSPAEAVDAYAAALTGAGYTEESNAAADGTVMKGFAGNGWTITVAAAEADGTTSLTVAGSPDQ